MEHFPAQSPRRTGPTLSRRVALRYGTTAATGALLAAAPSAQAASGSTRLPTAGAELVARDPFQTIFAALDRYPVVALAEDHFMQQMHDFVTAMLLHPQLPSTLTDVVVEFGTAAFQDLADRYVLGDHLVARADLVQIWRQIGDPTWDAPVYEQLFHTVRAVNQRRPRHRRLRVLLGRAPVTMSQVLAHPSGLTLAKTLDGSASMDDHCAAVIEREVLAKGHHALVLAGEGHLLRGITRDGAGPARPNAASLLIQRHPGVLFVVDTQIVPPGPPADAVAQRLQTAVASWPRPSIALLAGTWLGALTETMGDNWINWATDRLISPAHARYETRADAILYLGPGETLLASHR